MAGRYASSARAWGECQRSGQRVRLDRLVSDGQVPGLMVAPEWYEPAHPQERPIDPTDPIALRRPSPNNDRLHMRVTFPRIDTDDFTALPELVASVHLGSGPRAAAAWASQPATGSAIASGQGSVGIAGSEDAAGSAFTASLGTVSMAIQTLPTGQAIAAAVNSVGIAADEAAMTSVDTLATASVGTAGIAATEEAAGSAFAASVGTVATSVTYPAWGQGAWGSGTWSN